MTTSRSDDIYIRDKNWKKLNPYTNIYIEKNDPKPALKKYLEEWLTSTQKDVPYHVRIAWDKPEPCHEFSEDFYFHK
ncbi:hypothetical protein BGZ82_002669 [Podila clonocystis]|nr:hypothetical protein BGZ82_002669 [Podila clonocystis]